MPLVRRAGGRHRLQLPLPQPDLRQHLENGYRAAFTAEELRTAAARGLLGDRTLALGGITSDRLAAVRDYGFGGAALLGSIWQQPSPEALHRTIDKIIAFKNL